MHHLTPNQARYIRDVVFGECTVIGECHSINDVLDEFYQRGDFAPFRGGQQVRWNLTVFLDRMAWLDHMDGGPIPEDEKDEFMRALHGRIQQFDLDTLGSGLFRPRTVAVRPW